VPGVAGLATDALQTLEIGRPVEGRPIVAVERGPPGAGVMLVIASDLSGVELRRRAAGEPRNRD
jgi:hypothetical protein